jgi:hypothetical protein
MPFDKVSADCVTNANGSVTCGTADQMDNGSLNTNNNNNNNSGSNHNWNNNNNTGSNQSGSSNGLNWSICINGINIKTGAKCEDNENWGWGTPSKITATGDQAIDVLTHMNPILGSGYDANGFFRQIGVYNGQHKPAQGRMFRCTVSPNAYKYTCQSLN